MRLTPVGIVYIVSGVTSLAPAYVSLTTGSNSAPRVAVVRLAGESGVEAQSRLSDALGRTGKTVAIDPGAFQPAVAAIGYGGSLNMSTEEARSLGAAIGCDFFVIGKVEVVARSEHAGESHREALIAMFTVDGRTGALASFELISESAGTRERALALAFGRLDERAWGLAETMLAYRARREAVIREPLVSGGGRTQEKFESVPAEGITPPEFLNRVRPDYTAQAERCDVSATVEAMAVFHASGEVGAIEIVRWAGFGLDEASIAAIRQLKFKPATRNGQPISVRALIRYNFRRVSQPTSSR
jgi:hypothetical protein